MSGIIGDDNEVRSESFAERIRSAVQPANSYSPSKVERREFQ